MWNDGRRRLVLNWIKKMGNDALTLHVSMERKGRRDRITLSQRTIAGPRRSHMIINSSARPIETTLPSMPDGAYTQPWTKCFSMIFPYSSVRSRPGGLVYSMRWRVMGNTLYTGGLGWRERV